MSLDDQRGVLRGTLPGTGRTSRVPPALVRLAVWSGLFAVVAAAALVASAATSGDAALRGWLRLAGWLATLGLVATLGLLWWRERRRADRRRRYEDWWTEVSRRQGFAPDAG